MANLTIQALAYELGLTLEPSASPTLYWTYGGSLELIMEVDHDLLYIDLTYNWYTSGLTRYVYSLNDPDLLTKINRDLQECLLCPRVGHDVCRCSYHSLKS